MNITSLAKKPYTYAKRRMHYMRHRKQLPISWTEYARLSKFDQGYRGDETAQLDEKKIRFSSPFWFIHSVNEIFVEEVYRVKLDSRQPVIIDCGSNIGLSVLYFKKQSPDAKLIAFEADPSVYEQLKHNIEQFHLTDVELVNAAVWDSKTQLSFASEGSVGGKLGDSGVDGARTIQVPTIRLRDYLNTPVDFLKIDIEGAEYNVLRDCKDQLANVKYLFVEYHSFKEDKPNLHEILTWIADAGFTYYIREAWNNMEYPYLKEYNAYYQMQLNIFCYR